MKGKRLKVIFIWALLLAVVSNGGAFLLGYLTGDQTLALLGALVITVLFAGFAGYKAASSLANDPEYQKKWNLTLLGASIAFVSGLFSAGIKYFLTGQLDFGVGFIPIIMAAIGAYLVERKQTSK
ncbi:MAG: hypothetical protein A2782_00845 [Candidatus Blackburnbacteria bacterium RIFCSPHIGHO2_01_FULL_43_15b]|uniref:Uncharacterized protein n=1 Tax=Candidatus Blackburnbacteria bacterium RIFCSPHIGHO2_01_FULL_43_15b TaxID=1797513 RepID=A0A1G1UZ27_9BACT|nr:MAG: hypothetical protein A2782_00845 [Candidatus Blackburnbacteria bacterium RIFCSPHIGHO2_01_FULL_43_15b]